VLLGTTLSLSQCSYEAAQKRGRNEREKLLAEVTCVGCISIPGSDQRTFNSTFAAMALKMLFTWLQHLRCTLCEKAASGCQTAMGRTKARPKTLFDLIRDLAIGDCLPDTFARHITVIFRFC
jgi:hypothetical protein